LDATDTHQSDVTELPSLVPLLKLISTLEAPLMGPSFIFGTTTMEDRSSGALRKVSYAYWVTTSIILIPILVWYSLQKYFFTALGRVHTPFISGSDTRGVSVASRLPVCPIDNMQNRLLPFGLLSCPGRSNMDHEFDLCRRLNVRSSWQPLPDVFKESFESIRVDGAAHRLRILTFGIHGPLKQYLLLLVSSLHVWDFASTSFLCSWLSQLFRAFPIFWIFSRRTQRNLRVLDLNSALLYLDLEDLCLASLEHLRSVNALPQWLRSYVCSTKGIRLEKTSMPISLGSVPSINSTFIWFTESPHSHAHCPAAASRAFLVHLNQRPVLGAQYHAFVERPLVISALIVLLINSKRAMATSRRILRRTLRPRHPAVRKAKLWSLWRCR